MLCQAMGRMLWRPWWKFRRFWLPVARAVREPRGDGIRSVGVLATRRYPRFLGEPGTCVVLGVCPGTVCTVEVCVVFLDTLTPVARAGVPKGDRLGPAAVWSAGVVLVGLHCSLVCGCGVVVGPFICDCETERWFLCCVVRVGYWHHEPVVRSHVVASLLSDSCFATGVVLCVEVALCFVEVSWTNGPRNETGSLGSDLPVRLVVEVFLLKGRLVVLSKSCYFPFTFRGLRVELRLDDHKLMEMLESTTFRLHIPLERLIFLVLGGRCLGAVDRHMLSRAVIF
ncbi:hypothetical protein Taro_016368 [Colocasia esculenta]|uniref:Uncharacterized protein n=1 Tax=Colocasia esculenta TaxID=4460 RepID=A0A843UNA9_COLES|nr:hypothetical protein [Colocasia esculenta]